MITKTIKITSNRQITIPKEIRQMLNTDIISFEIIDSKITIKPIYSVAGCLKEYNKNSKDSNFKDIREKAWERVSDDWKDFNL